MCSVYLMCNVQPNEERVCSSSGVTSNFPPPPGKKVQGPRVKLFCFEIFYIGPLLFVTVSINYRVGRPYMTSRCTVTGPLRHVTLRPYWLHIIWNTKHFRWWHVFNDMCRMGPPIILVLVWRKSFCFWRSCARNTNYTFSLSFPVTLTFDLYTSNLHSTPWFRKSGHLCIFAITFSNIVHLNKNYITVFVTKLLSLSGDVVCNCIFHKYSLNGVI